MCTCLHVDWSLASNYWSKRTYPGIWSGCWWLATTNWIKDIHLGGIPLYTCHNEPIVNRTFTCITILCKFVLKWPRQHCCLLVLLTEYPLLMLEHHGYYKTNNKHWYCYWKSNFMHRPSTLTRWTPDQKVWIRLPWHTYLYYIRVPNDNVHVLGSLIGHMQYCAQKLLELGVPLFVVGLDLNVQ